MKNKSGLASHLTYDSLDEPITHFVNHLFAHARQQLASDIHIEPYHSLYRIRYRLDGILHEMTEIESHLAARIITRLKVMASLDISERRLPQDGRLHIAHHQQNKLDVRMSTCPTLHGEKIVLRLLDLSKMTLSMEALGLQPAQKKLFLEKISQPQGLILVTGPTGSGKTMTLYSALHYLNTKEKNIFTVEDPVEIEVKGINQVQINPKSGLSFPLALRAFLRQDPDIIMVGEIRDTLTAEISLQAAQTGHLVLSTLHTNSAMETLLRLTSMGCSPHHLTQALSLIIAQRLVRTLCPHCKQTQGCSLCHHGYTGRTGIFECLPLTKKISLLMLQNADPHTLLQAAQEEGFITLQEAGMQKVAQGLTSITELNRVLPHA